MEKTTTDPSEFIAGLPDSVHGDLDTLTELVTEADDLMPGD